MGKKKCGHFGCYPSVGCCHGPNCASALFEGEYRHSLKTEAVLSRIADVDLAKHPKHPKDLTKVLTLFIGLLGESIGERCKIIGWDPNTGKPSKYGWCEPESWNGTIGYNGLWPDAATFNALVALILPDQPVVIKIGGKTIVVENRQYYDNDGMKSDQRILLREAREL